MSEFGFVVTVADFKTLNEGEVLEGYLDGFSGAPEPGSGHSRSYWHGWRNGAIESERHVADWAYVQLDKSFKEQAAYH